MKGKPPEKKRLTEHEALFTGMLLGLLLREQDKPGFLGTYVRQVIAVLDEDSHYRAEISVRVSDDVMLRVRIEQETK